MEVEFGKILENCFIAFEPGSERSYPSYHAHSNGKLCTGKSTAFLSIWVYICWPALLKHSAPKTAEEIREQLLTEQT